MKPLFANYLFILCILSSCSKQEGDKIKSYTENIEEIYLFDLAENLSYLGSVKSFNFINDTLFAVSSKNPSKVIYYNLKGKQIKEISTGIGAEGEFKNPGIIKNYKNELYVWCSDFHKLFVYDKNGYHIKDIPGIASSIADFGISDNYIFYYTDGGIGTTWLSIYDLNKNKIIKEYGSVTNEQILLDRHTYSGGITTSGNNMYAVASNSLSIHQFDLDDLTPSLFEIFDPEFKVDSLFEDPYMIVNQNRKKMIEYLFDNSYVNGIFSINSNLLIKAETGKMQLEGSIVGNKGRFENYYLFNKESKTVKAYRKPQEFYVEGLFAADSKDLYRIHMKEGESSYTYSLYKMNFN